MANEKDKKDKEEKRKVRCADYAVSYSVRLDGTSTTCFQIGRMKLMQKPDETLMDFEAMTMDSGMAALRIAEEIESELKEMKSPGTVCIINFWPIRQKYWEEVGPWMNKGMDSLPG